MAIEVDGGTMYVACGSGASIDNIFDGGGTVAVWIYDDGAQGNNYGRIFHKWDTNGWALTIDSDSNIIALDVDFNDTNGKWSIARQTQNVWYHLAIQYDIDNVGNDPTFYVNAAIVAENEDATPVGTRNTDAASNLYLANRSNQDRGLNGKLEDVRMFGRILTGSEIENLAAGYRGPLGGEVMWLSMCEARTLLTPGTLTQGTHLLPDLSANTNDGDPFGNAVLVASNAPRMGVLV